MSKLRVLHLIKSLDIGGIENLALDFCRNAAAHDIDMHLICIGGGELETDFAQSGASYHRFPKLGFPYDIIDPLLVRRLRRYIKKHQIDVVHSHFADEGLHMYLATRRMKKTLKVVSIAVDLRINRKIDNFKFRFLAPRVDLSISPTNSMVRQLNQFGMNTKSNAHCVYNGVDPARVLQKKKSSLREDLGVSDKAILGGMIGNFYNGVRDQFTVVQALPELIKTYPNFHFVFAGGSRNQWIKSNSSYFDQCYNYCREQDILQRVHFLGLRKDVANILRGLDFYVHSTSFDTFGIAPVEAMFSKLPVIGNDIPVFREVSGEGKAMLLFKDKDPADLSDKISHLLSNREKRKALGAEHHDFARKHYHINNHIKSLKELYLKSLAEL